MMDPTLLKADYRVQHSCHWCVHFTSDWQCAAEPPYPRVEPSGVCDRWAREPRLNVLYQEPLAAGVIDRYVMPCPRETKNQRSKRYLDTKSIIGVSIAESFKVNGRIPPMPFIKVPFFFGLSITMPPTQKGLYSETAGDYDNFIKSFLDSAKATKAIVDDNPKHYRGVAQVGPKRSRLRLGDAWRFEWAFYECVTF